MITRAPFLRMRYSAYLHREVPEEDAELTHVGPGTPCGEYMRRFWQPICFSDELSDLPRRVKILDEELIWAITTRPCSIRSLPSGASGRGRRASNVRAAFEHGQRPRSVCRMARGSSRSRGRSGTSRPLRRLGDPWSARPGSRGCGACQAAPGADYSRVRAPDPRRSLCR